jgi:predicted nucleic acid-binding protein
MSNARPEFLDTNILVYEWDERDRRKQEIARAVVRKVGRQGVISSQVIQEFASVMRTRLGATSEQLRLILASYRGFGFLSIDHEAVEGALRVADEHRVSFWDALILTAAVKSGCKTLYTEDLNPGQVIEGVKVLNPFL